MDTPVVEKTVVTRRAAGVRAPNLKPRRRFLRHFPGGFRDPAYLEWERNYKCDAHRRWQEELAPEFFLRLLKDRSYTRIAQLALAIESRMNLLLSFEKMALRDAVSLPGEARTFATGLYEILHGAGSLNDRFEQWRDAVGRLPLRQTRIWPVLTVFPFIAQPSIHLYLKPTVTRTAADAYGYAFAFRSTPNFETYKDLLSFGNRIRRDLGDLRPRDQIDIQSFIWVIGSDEYS